MGKSRTELLEYGKKILSRGDGYYAVTRYLERNEMSESDSKYILDQLRILEKQGGIKPANEPLKKPLDFSIVLGALFLVGGVAMLFLLWDNGIIAVLPFALIGVGILGLTKTFR